MKRPYLVGLLSLLVLFVISGTASAKDWPMQINVEPQKTWNIKFNQNVDPDSVNIANIYVATDEIGNNKVNGVSVSLATNNTEQVKVVPPVEGWQPGEDYYLFVSSRVKSSGGKLLNKEYRMQFNVRPTMTAICDVYSSSLGASVITVVSTSGIPGASKFMVSGGYGVTDIGYMLGCTSISNATITILACNGTTMLATGTVPVSVTATNIRVELVPVSVASITPIPDINVAYGTVLPPLPPTVEVVLNNGTKIDAVVTWDKGSPVYNAVQRRTYVFNGTITLPTGIIASTTLSASVNVIVEPDLPPDKPTGFNVCAGNRGELCLSWDPSTAEDFKFYRIYAKSDPDEQFALEYESVSYDKDASRIDNFNLPDGTIRFYCVTAVDQAGNESMPSRTLWGVTLAASNALYIASLRSTEFYPPEGTEDWLWSYSTYDRNLRTEIEIHKLRSEPEQTFRARVKSLIIPSTNTIIQQQVVASYNQICYGLINGTIDDDYAVQCLDVLLRR